MAKPAGRRGFSAREIAHGSQIGSLGGSRKLFWLWQKPRKPQSVAASRAYSFSQKSAMVGLAASQLP
jgi:hypothetical protein